MKKNTDLIIIPGPETMTFSSKLMGTKDSCDIKESSEIDFEKLATQQLQNIFLANFELLDPDFIQTIISLKSTRTEIIGLTNTFTRLLKETLLDVEQYKDIGMSNDEISVLLVLKHDRSPIVVNKCMDHYERFTGYGSKFKSIENVSEVIALLKHT